MKKALIFGTTALILGATLVSSTYAARGGYRYNSTYTPGTNTASSTFVDANSNGICDTYETNSVTRPLDGTGQRRGMMR
ncbi:MAG: hypothetical protein PHZ26_01635 [Candidatus Gracilibacteria bacterium]|nr:hypothetical protein [Candidatus Gracilibacteria bacterium]MDD2908435.1 hypothetical protein [Candidatus Gracilibacteria bacterium]